jgi:copper chaperone
MATELKLIEADGGSGCSCCVAPAATTTNATKERPMTGQEITTSYTVSGMTCGHCVASVTEEVSAIEGVTGVQVDLATGEVTVSSAAPLAEADVRAAVDEAGYQLVG